VSEQEYCPVEAAFNPASAAYRAWRGESVPAAPVAAEVVPEPSGKPVKGSTKGETQSPPVAK
jgi:hypothetical protein